MATALVVDDDADLCWILTAALATRNWRAMTADCGKRALQLQRQRQFPVAFVDARLPDIDGLVLAAALRQLRPQTRIILISGYYFADDAVIAQALKEARIDAFLAKPFDLDAIAAALQPPAAPA